MKFNSTALPLSRLWTIIFAGLFLHMAQAQVSGVVFRDFNANGAQDNSATFVEPGLDGVTVTAYPATGATQMTTSAASTGAYSFSGLALPVRLEFSGFPSGYFSGAEGTGSPSSVQFVSAASTTANFGVNYPSDYCQANPQVALSCYVGGKLSGTGQDDPAFIKFNYYGNNTYIDDPAWVAPLQIAKFKDVGAVSGASYSKYTKKMYAAAILRRHVAFGPLGVGGIYEIDPLTGVATSWLDIETFGLDAGTDTRNNSDPANALPDDKDDKSYDVNAFPLLGKMALGDVEISDDGQTMYVVNLFDQTLLAINTSTKALISTTSISAGALGLTCPQSDFRPWGLKYYHGKLYVGAVCSAESTQSATDLKGYVLEFTGSGFSVYYSFDLNYVREQGNEWLAWNTTAYEPGVGAEDNYHPQPILSDIEFDVDGSMILGLLDRHSIMFSSANYPPNPAGSGNQGVTPFSAGDILRVCKVGAGFVLECTNNFPYSGGGEFYNDKRHGGNGNGNIKEDGGGSLAFLPGSNEILSTTIDEFDVNENGVGWFNNTTGERNRAYMIFDKDVDGSQGKTSGLGDIEMMCDLAPIEIGNRLWSDTNNDGIQDPGESPISNVTIQLYAANGTTLLATSTTDAAGKYKFSQSGTSGQSWVNSSGLTSAIQPLTTYVVRVGSADWAAGLGTGDLTGLFLTLSNIGGAGQPDARDNDATLVSTVPQITYTTGNAGENNHTLDMGFSMSPPVSCSLTSSGKTLESCNNNASTASGTDDYITFSLNPTGTGLGATYSVTASSGVTVTLAAGGAATGIAYGTATAFHLQNGSANGTLYTITVTDANGGPCVATATVQQNGCSTPVPACITPVLTVSNASACAGTTTNLSTLVISNAPAGTLTFHATQADATAGTNALLNTVVMPAGNTLYYLRSSVSSSCFSTAVITVSVIANPLPTVLDGVVCAGGSIDLNSLVTSSGGGSLTYYTTFANAEAGSNALVSTMVTPATATKYYLRSAVTSGGVTCYAVREIVVSLTSPSCGTSTATGPN